MVFLISMISVLVHATTLELPNVLVEGDPKKTESSRSIQWPVYREKPKSSLNLPQPDDALNAINGLQVRTQGSPTFSIRGAEATGRTLVLYNHIPLNFSSGFGAPRIFFPKETLSHVNLLKGPSSLFYGSQAMSGAVDFIPRKYERPIFVTNFSDTNESFLPWRSGGLAHHSWQLATPIINRKKNFLQSSLFYEQDDGAFPYQVKGASGVRENNSQDLLRTVFNGESSLDKISISYDFILAKQNQISPGPVDNPYVTEQENTGGLLSITPHYFFTDQTSLKARVTHLFSDSEFLENGLETYTVQKTTILQNEFIHDWNPRTQLQLFADGFFHEMDNSFVGDNLKNERFELGPFMGFHSFEFLKHQIGGRYLTVNNKFLPSFSTHYLEEDFDLWFSYSQGFHNPSLNDLYANSPFFVGNSSLTPEESSQYEVGIQSIKTNPTDYFWEVRFFHMEYKNFIETFEINPGIFSRANRGEGYSRGMDLSLSKVWGSLTGELNYNFLETENRQLKRPFRLSPKHQLSWSLTKNWSRFQFQVQNTHWYGTFDVQGNQSVPLEDWQQWNFFVFYQINSNIQINTGLINAFNQGKLLALNYPEPQRKYWLQFVYQF